MKKNDHWLVKEQNKMFIGAARAPDNDDYVEWRQIHVQGFFIYFYGKRVELCML